MDLDIVCDTSSSSAYFPWYVGAWFAVLIGVIGIPLVILWELQQNRHYLDAPHTRHLLGFMFLGYEAQYYWWGIWVIYRKALLYALVVLMQTQDVNL